MQSKIVMFPRKNYLYILTDDRQVVPTFDYGLWAFSLNKTRAPFQTRTFLHRITTAFIGIDCLSNNPPRLFQTFVHGIKDSFENSYSSYHAARVGHWIEVAVCLLYEFFLLMFFIGAFILGFELVTCAAQAVSLI